MENVHSIFKEQSESSEDLTSSLNKLENYSENSHEDNDSIRMLGCLKEIKKLTKNLLSYKTKPAYEYETAKLEGFIECGEDLEEILKKYNEWKND